MTDVPNLIHELRELLGTGALERLTGLDRRTIQRVDAGLVELYPDTLDRLRQGLAQAAALAGPPAETPPTKGGVAVREGPL